MDQKNRRNIFLAALAVTVVVTLGVVGYWHTRNKITTIKPGDSVGRLSQYREDALPDTIQEISYLAEHNNQFVDFVKTTAQHVGGGRKNALFSLCKYSPVADFCCPTETFPPVEYQVNVYYIPTSYFEEGKPFFDYNNILKMVYSNNQGIITEIIDGMTINDYTLSKKSMQRGLARCKSI